MRFPILQLRTLRVINMAPPMKSGFLENQWTYRPQIFREGSSSGLNHLWRVWSQLIIFQDFYALFPLFSVRHKYGPPFRFSRFRSFLSIPGAMPSGKKLSDPEQAVISALHTNRVSKKSIARQLGRSVKVIRNCLYDPVRYGSRTSPGRPKMLSLRERRLLCR